MINSFSLSKKEYWVGAYIRLSKEDEEKELESESITNQRSLINQYVQEHQWYLYDTYIDDGYSGTNFDRPSFQRLLKDIEEGHINMVITKDMSRLGRDYIETGNYLERYFPEHGIRYIAINDHIDTFMDSSNNDILPFKAIMNDFYAKDISQKIKSSLRAKQKEGKFVGGRAPFGYQIDPCDKNHLVIEEEQAKIVKRIFHMAREGMTFYKIAKELTKENIKTPAEYYPFAWKNNYTLNYGKWNAKTIQDILTNQMYIGDMVQNRRSKLNYKLKKIVKNHPKNYIIVKNTHEPIITTHLFEEVQKKLPKNVGREGKKETHLLDGLLYCGDCRHRISITSRRKKDAKCYTICSYYRTHMKQGLCTTHSNNYDTLETIILNKIKETCLPYLNFSKIQNTIFSHNSMEKNNLTTQIQNQLDAIEKLNSQLDSIYLDQLNHQIDFDQYTRVSQKIKQDIRKREHEILLLKEKQPSMLTIDRKRMEKRIQQILSFQTFTREMAVMMIDRITIYRDKRIEIYLAFHF